MCVAGWGGQELARDNRDREISACPNSKLHIFMGMIHNYQANEHPERFDRSRTPGEASFHISPRVHTSSGVTESIELIEMHCSSLNNGIE